MSPLTTNLHLKSCSHTDLLNNFYDETLGSIVVIHIIFTLYQMPEKSVKICNISLRGNFKYLFRLLYFQVSSVLCH
jgi:hypothetical protein